MKPVASPPTVSPAIKKINQSNSAIDNSSSSASSADNIDSNSDTSNTLTARNSTNTAPASPKPDGKQGISCISNCQPEYPATLAGEEGSAGINLTIDNSGNVTSATIVRANSNNQINRQALLAARQMKFSSSNGNNASVQVTINFTVAGSEYDRLARLQQREREREELARQQQLEREREATGASRKTTKTSRIRTKTPIGIVTTAIYSTRYSNYFQTCCFTNRAR